MGWTARNKILIGEDPNWNNVALGFILVWQNNRFSMDVELCQ